MKNKLKKTRNVAKVTNVALTINQNKCLSWSNTITKIKMEIQFKAIHKHKKTKLIT